MGRKIKDKVPPAAVTASGTLREELPAVNKAKSPAEDSTADAARLQQSDGTPATERPDHLARLLNAAEHEVPQATSAVIDDVAQLGGEEFDDRVRQIIRSTVNVEIAAWVIRGACGYEVATRPGIRYPAGPGRPDVEGTGLRSTLYQLAESCGVALPTLEDDVRIFKTFVAERLDHGTSPEALRAARAALIEELFALPRGYFLVAVSTPDPARSVEIAERRLNERDQVKGYSVGKFRAEVKPKPAPSETETADSDDADSEDKLGLVEITCSVTTEEYDCLGRIMEATSASIDRAVGRSLRHYWDDMRPEPAHEEEVAA